MRSLHQLSPAAVMARRRYRLHVVGVVVVAVMACAAAAETLDVPVLPAAAPDTTAAVAPGPAPTAFGVEVAAALAVEKDQLAALQIRFDAAPDEVSALVVQREIAEVKAATELAILHIQARHARAVGSDEDADRILAAAARLTAPAPVVQPAPRSAPAPGQETTAR